MRQSKSLTHYKKVGSTVLTFSLVTITVVGARLAVLSSVANVDDGTSFAEQGPAQMIKPDEDIRVRASDAYGKLPLHFETNRGQSDPQVRFLARASRESLFLTPTEAVLTLTKRESPKAPTHGTPEPRGPRTGTVLRMTFAGANPTPRMIGLEELPGNSNYFLGNDSAKWRTHVPTYAKVRYDDLYPGVDLIYYGTQRQLEYDFVVRAGADPTRILLGFKGAERQEVDDQGDLVLHTAAGPIRQRKPVVYQEIDGARQEVAGGYVLTATHQVGFRIGAYDTSRPLIIDPVLVYSSYLSGGDTDEGQGIAVDSAGNAYVTGFTQSTNFPTVAGAFQPTSGGGAQDAFVTKLDPAGSAIVYSTYLGGSDVDNGSEIAVDAAGNAYVTGFTQSTNFPTTAGALETSFGGSYDAFVTKISSDGSALVCSTYLGGSSVEFGIGIAVDALGNAYVTGWSNSDDFPTTAGAFQTSLGGGPHTFVTKLDPAGSPLYSTFLGDTVANLGLGIAVDAAGNAYVTGGALSTSFPTTVGAFQTTFGGGFEDAYVTKLNPTGSALVYSTYLGGSDTDHTFGIAVDAAGNAYVTGYTKSTNFPTTAGAFQPTFGGGPQDAFVTKLDPTGSTLVYSTYLARISHRTRS